MVAGIRRLLLGAMVTLALTVDTLAWGAVASAPVRLPLPGSPGDLGATVTVQRGDHLWKISEQHLHTMMGTDPTNSEISPYWRRVVDHNRGRLRSGHPDLIYPGEVIELPAIGVSERR